MGGSPSLLWAWRVGGDDVDQTNQTTEPPRTKTVDPSPSQRNARPPADGSWIATFSSPTRMPSAALLLEAPYCRQHQFRRLRSRWGPAAKQRARCARGWEGSTTGTSESSGGVSQMTESRFSRLAPDAVWSQDHEEVKGGGQRWSERGSRVRTDERSGGSGGATEAGGGGGGGAEGSTVAGAAQEARATRGSQRGRFMVGRIAEGRLLGLKQAPSTGAQWNERDQAIRLRRGGHQVDLKLPVLLPRVAGGRARAIRATLRRP